jgi:tellurite methyltransferase
MTDDAAYDSAAKWNERYLLDKRFSDAPVRSLIIKNSDLLPKSGWALEIAGGMGVTTDYLQRFGFNVVELDIAFNALKTAHSHNSSAFHIVADAKNIPIRKHDFNVICNFYFLERGLFPQIDSFLAPGGLLFFETMTIEMLSVKPETPPIQLLQPGELKNIFTSYETLYYFEGWTTSDHRKQKAIAQLIARKPIQSV